MNRRTLLTRALALAGAAVVAPSVATAEASDNRDAFDRAWDAIKDLNTTSRTEFELIDSPTLADLAALKHAVGHEAHPGWTAGMLLQEIEAGRLHLGVTRAGGITVTERWCTEHLDPVTGAGHWHPTNSPLTPYGEAIEDARAEGYLRGLDVGRAGAESRVQKLEGLEIDLIPPSLTFGAMVADCAARGCALDRAGLWAEQAWLVCHIPDPAAPVLAFGKFDAASGESLAEVNAWRQSLHAPTFEAMQRDCYARGCALVNVAGSPVAHLSHIGVGHEDVRFDDFMSAGPDLATIDAWRQSLHAPTFGAMVADCAARGCELTMTPAPKTDDFRIVHRTVPGSVGSVTMYVGSDIGFTRVVDDFRRGLHGEG